MNEQNPVDLAALDRLASLYRDGLITREEFERAKAGLFPSGPQITEPEVMGSEGAAEFKKLEFDLPSPVSASALPPQDEAPSSSSGLRRIDISDRPTPPMRAEKRTSNRGRYAAIAIAAILSLGGVSFFLIRGAFNVGEAQIDETWESSPKAAESNLLPKITPEGPTLGDEYDSRIERIVSLQNDYADKTLNLGLRDTLSPNRMSTKAGRAKSRSDIKSLATFFEEYLNSMEAESLELSVWYSAALGRDLVEAAKLTDSVSSLRTELRKMFEIYRKAIGYADSFRPSVERKRLVFRTGRQVTLYNSTLKSVETQEGKVDKAAEVVHTLVAKLLNRTDP